MIGKIISMVSCLLCAIPFFIISVYGKDSHTPITFWAGDGSLDKKVRNIKDYNGEMAHLYKVCAAAFAAAGLCCLLHMALGVIAIILECTVGLYLVYQKYKKILGRYS